MNTPELVGACSYVFNAPDNMYYPDRLWKAVLQENTNPIFLWQLLWYSDVRKAIKEKSGGTSGTMHNISKPNLLAIKCMDAPIELQNQFATFVEQTNKSKFDKYDNIFTRGKTHEKTTTARTNHIYFEIIRKNRIFCEKNIKMLEGIGGTKEVQ